MPHNQGGLNSIESISGVQPPTTSAVEKVTLLNTDYDYTRTQSAANPGQGQFLGLTKHGNTVNFSASTLDNMFMDGNYVGGNKLAPEDVIRQGYMQKGAGANIFSMA